MTREQKSEVVSELKDKFKENTHFYLTDSSGLSVAKINEFRRLCYSNHLEYKVFKNTLIIKALQELDKDYMPIKEQLRGFSGIVFSKETANTPAKIISSFRKKSSEEKPLLKVASIDNDYYIGDENLAMLGKLKSKEELVGDVLSLLQSPAKNVISALMSGKNKLAGLVKTLSEK